MSRSLHAHDAARAMRLERLLRALADAEAEACALTWVAGDEVKRRAA